MVNYAICTYCWESSDKHPYPDAFIISQLFLSIANALHGSLALTLSIKNVGISLLSDLYNADYAVHIAVLTTKYEYVQQKYTK